MVAMPTSVSLGQFVAAHRTDIVQRCLLKVAKTEASETAELDFGIPAFLDQLIEDLDVAGSKTREIRATATKHGHNLFLQGLTASEVVHVYGSVCQSVTDLAVETSATVTANDFRTLNRCLDDAIAGAVSEYTRQQGLQRDDQVLIHSVEARNLLSAAMTAFDMIHTGTVGVGGSTGALLRRSLVELQRLL